MQAAEKKGARTGSAKTQLHTAALVTIAQPPRRFRYSRRICFDAWKLVQSWAVRGIRRVFCCFPLTAAAAPILHDPWPLAACFLILLGSWLS